MNHSISISQNQDYAVCNLGSNKHNSKRLAGQSIRKMLIVIFATSLSITVFSQNYIYVGDKKYIATPTWQFDKKTGGDLNVCVANTQTGGLLVLSTEVDYKEYIGGVVSLILTDGTLINLTERVSTDYVDHKAISLYKIDKSIFDKLKMFNIEKLRYNIKGEFGGGSYTAEIHKSSFFNIYTHDFEYNDYATAFDIARLDSQNLSEKPDSSTYAIPDSQQASADKDTAQAIPSPIYLYINSAKYLSTAEWQFTNDTKISVAKTNTGGLLVIRRKMDRLDKFTESVMVFLDNGDLIQLTIRKMSDYSNGIARTCFIIKSSADYSLLKEHNILSIILDVGNNSLKGITAKNNSSPDGTGSVEQTAIDIKALDDY